MPGDDLAKLPLGEDLPYSICSDEEAYSIHVSLFSACRSQQQIWIAVEEGIAEADGLHQRVSLQGLIKVEVRQALYIKARQPHGAGKDHTKRVVRILELFIELPAHTLLPVRKNIRPHFSIKC